MSTEAIAEKVKFVPLYVYDNTSRKDDGSYHGCFDLITKPTYTNGVKVIGTVIPYGGEHYLTREEAEVYAKLFAASSELLEAVQFALKIQDLWSARGYKSVPADHAGEFEALQAMQTRFETAISKATL